MSFFLGGCGPASGALGSPCDPTSPCSSGACVVGRCRTTDTAPVAADATRLVLVPADLAVISSGGEDDRLAENIALGRASAGSLVVLLRYAPTWQDGAQIEAAFVVLEPLAGAPTPYGPISVETARILEPWAAETASWGRQPRLAVPAAAGRVRPGPAAPLRIDVTSIVRGWSRRAEDDHGIALLSSGDDPYGAVFTTGLTSGKPPALEVYVR